MSSKNKLVAHTLVKNEARWIWYALNSALDFVDEIMVWDTGSDDSTPEIVKSINSNRIKFKEIGSVDAAGHTKARQAMLEATDSEWILILDGDEIWYKQSLISCIDVIMQNPHLAAIISPFINVVGDIYHYQSLNRSKYQIGNLRGAYNLRFINRKIPGLHVGNPHGRQEYRDANEIPVQNFPAQKLQLVDKQYFHTTHLPRSISQASDSKTLKRSFKFRYELGSRFPVGYVYPEVFYLPRPANVPDPWAHRSPDYFLKSLFYEPARLMKNLINSNPKDGY